MFESDFNALMMKKGEHWLDKRLAELPDKKQADLARHLGIPQSRFSELKRGEWKIPHASIPEAASFLEMSTDNLLKMMGIKEGPMARLPQITEVLVSAEVAAGKWGEHFEWPPEDCFTVTFYGPEDRFPRLTKYGVQVVGDSMDKVFPEGTILECIKYIELGEDPRDGEYVIVHRRDKTGLYECTVKRFREDADGHKWLEPESTNPDFQAPIFVNDTGEEDSVLIYARVTRAQRDY